MSTIVTRSGKGSPLTHTEVDNNFTNLNADKTENASAAITGGTINNTVIGNVTPNAGTFTTLTATGQTSLGGAAGSEGLRVTPLASSTTYINARAGVNGGNAQFGLVGTGNTDFIQHTLGTGAFRFLTNGIGQDQMRITHTASAVNFVQVTGAATGGVPTISVQGSDSTVGMRYVAKGGFVSHTFESGQGQLFQVTGPANGNFSSNRLLASSAGGNFSPTLEPVGSDTNIANVFRSKGTGAINLAPGSSGVNISNGGTVTAVTVTANGGSYTSPPTWSASAPTTAGGVQATGTTIIGASAGLTINSGGTGYTAGDLLTVSGGTRTQAAVITVNTVSAGVITAATVTTFGQYSAVPTNPVSVTGGTGTSATFTLTYFVRSCVIGTAGSGYVEQPTVTFSGGGGSGAAAYATVGSDTLIRSLGQNIAFTTPNGRTGFRVVDFGGATGTGHWNALGGTTGPQLRATGATSGIILTESAVPLSLQTGSTEQFRVNHTTSAVNFVQVTGAATGSSPNISSQGSDSFIGLQLQAKTASIIFLTRAGQGRSFNIADSNGPVNFLQVQGTTTGFGPVLSAQGSDTNIPLVLQPKGTGALQAQQTDSTATGGNARGPNAVDWQTLRGAATQVASGQLSATLSGASNTANAIYSTVAGGNQNTCSGTYAFLGGGILNTGSGFASAVIGGNSNQATGAYTFTGTGRYNVSSGPYSATAGGENNLATGFHNFIGGGFKNSGTANAAVTTQSGTMNATTAVTLSGSNASIRVGQYVTGTSIQTDPPTYVAAISGTSLTLSQAASGSSTSTLSFFTPHGVVVGGGNNQATGAYSFIGGGGDAGTAANRNVASGEWSTVAGGWANRATGIASTIAGGGTFGGTASGNVSSGTASFVGAGWGNIASGSASSVVAGASNQSAGTFSAVLGGVLGLGRLITGHTAMPASDNPLGTFTLGGSQAGLLVLAKQTTDATATVLTSTNAGAGTGNQVILPNNSAYFFRGEVVSGVTGGGNSKSWTIEGLIKRGANAASTTLVGVTVMSPFADVGAATWTIAVTADTTNGGLRVTFTGQAGTTIRTVAQIRTTEMTF